MVGLAGGTWWCVLAISASRAGLRLPSLPIDLGSNGVRPVFGLNESFKWYIITTNMINGRHHNI